MDNNSEALGPPSDDPNRLVTEADVRMLWHLLLDRRRVHPRYLARHVGKTPLSDLRRAIINGAVFQRVTGP